MRLVDFAPEWRSGTMGVGERLLSIRCPACGKLRIALNVVAGPMQQVGLRTLWGANHLTDDWDTLSITPSINAEHGRADPEPDDCRGWHGFITNGEIT